MLRFKHVFKLYLIRWIFHPVKLNFTGDDYIPHFKNFVTVNRKWEHSLRDIFNTIFYLFKTGFQWRMLPKEFASWNTVYSHYRQWKLNGTIEFIHEALEDMARSKSSRAFLPSVACIDSRSIKTTRSGGICRGVDGGKKVKGRKQHIITDKMGLILAVFVHAANIHDSKAGIDIITMLKGRFSRLNKIVADGGYRGELIETVIPIVFQSELPRNIEIIPNANQYRAFGIDFCNG